MKRIVLLVVLIGLSLGFSKVGAVEIPFQKKINAQKKRTNSFTKVYDELYDNLKRELKNTKGAVKRADLVVRISKVSPLKDFWDQEDTTVILLRNALEDNPDVFEGNEAKEERFRVGLNAKHDYQTSMNDLLNRESYTNEEVSALREIIIKNNLELMILARAGKPKKVVEAKDTFALNLNKIRTSIDVYNLTLGTTREDYELEIDPVKKAELKAQIRTLRKQHRFWTDDLKASDRLKRKFVVNSTVLVDNNKLKNKFLNSIDKKSQLQDDIDEAISLGKEKKEANLKVKLNKVNARLQSFFNAEEE